jgi:hypothetical protein
MLVFDPPCSVVLFLATGVVVQEAKTLLTSLGLHVVKMHKSFRHAFTQLANVKKKKKRKKETNSLSYTIL